MLKSKKKNLGADQLVQIFFKNYKKIITNLFAFFLLLSFNFSLPDPRMKMKAYPCGSGSTALIIKSCLF